IASVDDVHPVVTTWLYPRNPKRIWISLDIVPIVPLGMQKRLTCLMLPECQSRYCSSENSCAPPPDPMTIPISRFSSIDIEAGSSPPLLMASAQAAIPRGTTLDTC